MKRGRKTKRTPELVRRICDLLREGHTRAALVEAGADPASVYTRDELRALVEQHSREPITAAELLRIHGARRAFNGRLTE